MNNLILFIIWCASIAGDFKTYIVATENEENAVKTIPLFMRQDFEVSFASLDQACDYGCKYIGDDTVIFEDKFFVYNPKTKRLEFDSLVNYDVRPDLKSANPT